MKLFIKPWWINWLAVVAVIVAAGVVAWPTSTPKVATPPPTPKPAIVNLVPPTFPAYWNFPAPKNLTAYNISSFGYRLKWSPVAGPQGQKPISYTVETLDSGGHVVDKWVSGSTDTAEYGPGGKGLTNDKYTTKVWANGGELNTPGVASTTAVVWYTSPVPAPAITPPVIAVPATPAPVTAPTEYQQIVSYAKLWLGVPYVWGGASWSGVDCSGFTMEVYAHFGHVLPHYAEYQYEMFRAVDQYHLEPGDLVFFHTSSGYVYHVGIWVSPDTMIDAPHTGTVVQYNTISGVGAYYTTFGTITH